MIGSLCDMSADAAGHLDGLRNFSFKMWPEDTLNNGLRSRNRWDCNRGPAVQVNLR